MRFLLPIAALLTACSFASANDVPDIHDIPALGEPEDVGPIAYDISDEPLWLDAHRSCVQAQLDAEAMLADVAAAHDAEAALVLRDRERVGAAQ